MKDKQDITQMPSYQALMPSADTVQCAGCPDQVLVQINRPGHLTDCGECSLHCQCGTDTRGAGYELNEI
jgi:hypothetical protein